MQFVTALCGTVQFVTVWCATELLVIALCVTYLFVTSVLSVIVQCGVCDCVFLFVNALCATAL